MFAFEPQVPHKIPEFLVFMKPGLTCLTSPFDIIILHFIHFKTSLNIIILFAGFYEAGVFSHWVVRFGSGRWVAGVKFAVRGHAATTRTLHGLWTSRPCRRFAGSCMKLTYLGCLVWIWQRSLWKGYATASPCFCVLRDVDFFARQWQHIQLFVKHSFLKDWRCGYSKVGLMLWLTIGCHRPPKKDDVTEVMTEKTERSLDFFPDMNHDNLIQFDQILGELSITLTLLQREH